MMLRSVHVARLGGWLRGLLQHRKGLGQRGDKIRSCGGAAPQMRDRGKAGLNLPVGERQQRASGQFNLDHAAQGAKSGRKIEDHERCSGIGHNNSSMRDQGRFSRN